MAVLLVAAFPILVLINGAVACAGLGVGILLLYLDNRQGWPVARSQPAASAIKRRSTSATVRASA